MWRHRYLRNYRSGASSDRTFDVELTAFKALIFILSVAMIFIIIFPYRLLFVITRDGVPGFEAIGGQVQSLRELQRHEEAE